MTLSSRDAERVTRFMALRSDRHRIRPIAALALDAVATIGPRCATIHVGQEDEITILHTQAGYTTATDVDGHRIIGHSLDNREESIYGLLEQSTLRENR